MDKAKRCFDKIDAERAELPIIELGPSRSIEGDKMDTEKLLAASDVSRCIAGATRRIGHAASSVVRAFRHLNTITFRASVCATGHPDFNTMKSR
jgi:hypothetical protein